MYSIAAVHAELEPSGLWLLPQLGVDNGFAYGGGYLAGNSAFFGIALAEITSANTSTGSWENGHIQSQTPAQPFNVRSGNANGGASAGIFTAGRWNGDGNNTAGTSHRTILSGY